MVSPSENNGSVNIAQQLASLQIKQPQTTDKPGAGLEVKATVAGQEALSQIKEPKKEQLDKTKCWKCRVKVGLLGFKCRCNYVFCAKHRYNNEHDCDFDYKTQAREELARNNPKVVASKIVKI